MYKFVLDEMVSLFKMQPLLWLVPPQLMAQTGLQRKPKYYETYSNKAGTKAGWEQPPREMSGTEMRRK